MKIYAEKRKDPKRSLLWLVLCSPFAGILFVVGFTGILFLSGAVTFAEDCATPWSMWYLFGGCLLIVLASIAGIRPWSLKPCKLRPYSGYDLIKANKIGICFGLLSVLGGFVSTAAFIKAGLGFDMEANRYAFSRNLMEVSMFWRLMGPLVPFGFFATVLLIIYFEELRNLTRICLAAGILAVVLPTTMFLAGRECLVLEFATFVWCCGYRKVVGRPFFPAVLAFRLSIALVVVLASAVTLVISSHRTNKADQSQFALAATRRLITPNEKVLNRLEDLNPDLAVICTDTLTYTPAACAIFDRTVNAWKMRPDFVGVFFPMVQRRLASFGLVPDPASEAVQFEGLADENEFFANSLPTAAFDMMKSFGVVGGFCASVLLSFLAGRVYRKALERHSFTTICLAVLFFLFFFLWLGGTLFLSPIYEYALYWLFFAGLYRFGFKRTAPRAKGSDQVERVAQSLPSRN
ncbi:MAG: hypothetical protein ABR924_20280 [Terracidiphilus sp.]